MQAKNIVSVRKIGNINSMDIEVNNQSHIFYADGIATSNSHAISYGINAYWSAYCKYYRPIPFYVSYLNHARNKPDAQKEIKELVLDAKLNSIEIYPPRLGNLYKDFKSINDRIFFGLAHIKNVGDTESDKICSSIPNEQSRDFNWIQCLVEIIHKQKINKRAVMSLISVGAFTGKNNNEPRRKMLYEFDSWQQLTAREKEYISTNYANKGSLYECIDDLLMNFKLTSSRKDALVEINNALKNPFYDTEDSIHTIAQDEEKYLGCAITCSRSDASDASFSASLCKDICNGTIIGKTNIVVSIASIRTYKTKKGKNPGQLMAFLCVEDNSGILDSVTIFPEAYAEYKDLLTENNTVLINGEISKKDKSSLIVNKVTQV